MDGRRWRFPQRCRAVTVGRDFSFVAGEKVQTFERPLGPYFLSLFGGVLILADGILVYIAGAVTFVTQVNSNWVTIESLGIFAMGAGVVVILLASFLVLDPRHPFGYGVTVIALSLLSVFGGGGFYVGLALGVLGGIWMLYVEPLKSDAESSRVRLSAPLQEDQRCGRCAKLYSGSTSECPFCGAQSLSVAGAR